MEGKNAKGQEKALERVPQDAAAGGALARERGGPRPGALAADSCCVLQEVVREGRVVTVCVATCCEAKAAV